MNSKDSLGDRMKGYENISRIYLTRRCPVIIRIDGKAFHSFTRGFARPFDDVLINAMQATAKYLCENIMGCKVAYTQSDEISLLLTDYDKIETQAWFENNLQKMASISASMATMAFNRAFEHAIDNYHDYANVSYDESLCSVYCKALERGALFDARVFILPKEEVCNYFIWRQQDATRNSIQMVAQSNFSPKEMHGKSCNVLQDMLHEQKGINWNDYAVPYKRGTCVTKELYTIEVDGSSVWRSRWVVDKNIPIFTQNRDYIDNFVFISES